MTKFIILNKAEMMTLCFDKPLDICIDENHYTLCTEKYYLDQQNDDYKEYKDIKIKLKQFLMNAYDIRPSLSEKTVEEMIKRGTEFISLEKQKESEDEK